MRTPFLYLAIVTAVLGVGWSAYLLLRPRTPDPRILPPDEIDFAETYSNILPADYVGPNTCKECHPSQHSRWQRHPHSKMNRMASSATIQGDFANVRVSFPGADVRFTTDEHGKYYMTVLRDNRLHRRYLVTRTVGSRFMQFYIGKQVEGPEADDDPIQNEHMLPFAYWFKLKRWLPRQYFDPDGDEPLCHGVPQLEAIHRRPDVRPYNAVCMNCHNTFPYAFRMFNKDFVGFPDATVAGALEPLSNALAKTVPVQPTLESFESLNGRLDPEKHLVTLGISCESCHFGGREHAKHQKEIRFLPTSKFIRVKDHDPDKHMTPDRYNPVTVLGICVQCHSGNGRTYPNGAGKGNSREGLDFHAGFCTTKLRCVNCHEPHTPSAQPSGGPTSARHLALCVKCHDQYAEPKKALAHARHPVGARVDCMDCHMPRYTQGLDQLIRSHRISHPVEEVMVKEGSANACNVCHLDKSMRWTLDELNNGWGKKIEPQEDWAVYSRLDEPVGRLWLQGTDNHLRLIAAQCYARSPLGKKMLPELLRALNDPEPLNRVFTQCAVQRVRGQKPHELLAVDITDTPANRQAQIEALIKKMGPK
jgi:hypothetical protein